MAGQYDLYTKVGKYLKKSDKKPSASVVVDAINRPPVGAMQGSRSYATGQDVAPAQPVGVVHQNEGVLNQRAMNNLGKDTFVALAKRAEDGTLDLNKIRTSVGLNELAGYDGGGVVTPTTSPNMSIHSSLYPLEPEVKPKSDIYPLENVQAPATTPKMGRHLASVALNDASTAAAVTPVVDPNAPKMGRHLASVGLNNAQQALTVPAPQTNPVQASIPAPMVVPQAATEPAAGTNALSTTGTKAITSEDTYRTAAADYLHDVMTGNNKTQKNIADQTLNSLAARQQYSGAALNQSMAQNPNLTEGAKTTLTAQDQAQKSAETAKTAGSLAINAQNAQADAASQLYTGSLAGQQFEQQKAQYGDTQLWSQYTAKLTSGDYTGAGATYKAMTGNDIDMSTLREAAATAKLANGRETIARDAAMGAPKSQVYKDLQAIGVLSANPTTEELAGVDSLYDLNTTQGQTQKSLTDAEAIATNPDMMPFFKTVFAQTAGPGVTPYTDAQITQMASQWLLSPSTPISSIEQTVAPAVVAPTANLTYDGTIPAGTKARAFQISDQGLWTPTEGGGQPLPSVVTFAVPVQVQNGATLSPGTYKSHFINGITFLEDVDPASGNKGAYIDVLGGNNAGYTYDPTTKTLIKQSPTLLNLAQKYGISNVSTDLGRQMSPTSSNPAGGLSTLKEIITPKGDVYFTGIYNSKTMYYDSTGKAISQPPA